MGHLREPSGSCGCKIITNYHATLVTSIAIEQHVADSQIIGTLIAQPLVPRPLEQLQVVEANALLATLALAQAHPNVVEHLMREFLGQA